MIYKRKNGFEAFLNEMIKEDLLVAYAAFSSEDETGVAICSACVGYIWENTEEELKDKLSKCKIFTMTNILRE